MSRLDPKLRTNEILDAALIVAARPGGYHTMTRREIAEVAGCSEGLVSKYFGTMQAMRRSVMRAAVTQRNLTIIGYGLAAGNPHALNADPELRKLALSIL